MRSNTDPRLIKLGREYLEKVGVMEDVLRNYDEKRIMRSEGAPPLDGILYFTNEDDEAVIEEIEKSGRSLVVHVVDGNYRFPDGAITNMVTYLVVTTEDLEMELLPEIKKEVYESFSLVYNKTWGEKEYGSVGISGVNGGITRIY